MSGSERAQVALPPHAVRVVKLSYAIAAVVLVVLIVAVGELFLLRAASRADARRLACYVVRYSSDADPTAKEIRAAYRCPPAKALPRHGGPAGSLSPSRPVTAGSAPAPAGPASSASAPTAVGQHASAAAGVAMPSRAAPVTSARPAPTPAVSSSGILGGLLCDPASLPVCLKIGSRP